MATSSPVALSIPCLAKKICHEVDARCVAALLVPSLLLYASVRACTRYFKSGDTQVADGGALLAGARSTRAGGSIGSVRETYAICHSRPHS